jgi:glycosyltransferase involved in cell wall biosynthesis
MLLSIVVLSYNRPNQIKRIFEKILHAPSLDFNLIVKDDCSPKQFEIEEIIDSYHDLVNFSVVFYKNEKNLGFDKNLLDAFRVTNSDYVFLLSDDDYIDGHYIEALIKLLSKREFKVYFTPYKVNTRVSRLNIRPYKLSRFQDIIYNSILFSGLIFERNAVLSLPKDELFLGDCIYTQVYLSSLIIYNEKMFGESINGLLYLGGDGENYFGMNESANNIDLLKNRDCVTSNIKYQSFLLKVVDKIAHDTHHSIRSAFEIEYRFRLISYLLRARCFGLISYNKLVRYVRFSKLNTNLIIKFFIVLIYLLPSTICHKLLAICILFFKKSG